MSGRRTIMNEIIAERKRQIEVEGFDAEHDDFHDTEALINAALCYHDHALGRAVYDEFGVPVSWPWDASWWKPKAPRRDLIRSGALCLADQDRHARDGFPKQALPEQILQECIDAILAIDGARP